MPRKGDNTGVEQTCQYIDKVIDFLETLSDFDMPDGYEKDKVKMTETLEKIRSMNLELRNFGNKQYDEFYEMEKEKDYYEGRCRDLERENEAYRDDIKELQKEIDLH